MTFPLDSVAPHGWVTLSGSPVVLFCSQRNSFTPIPEGCSACSFAVACSPLHTFKRQLSQRLIRPATSPCKRRKALL